jgi:serine/threonine-protein kinase
MGAVYLVRHVHTDESLALKVLHAHVLKDESAVERFRREARAPARIGSEHVARVTDADTAADLDGAPFYVMELLRGRDLEKILVEDGPLSPVLLVEYLHQAARALDKAHAMGIVHRDLKPDNLFLTEREDGSPCIKLLDFGIARLWETDAPGQMKTQSGYVFGTPAYLSPEQALGNVEDVGPPTDVWALGLLVFKLLVGKEFWGAKNLAGLYAMILSEPIPLASARGSTLGPAFDAWLAKCLTRDRAQRFQSIGAAVTALGEALGVRINPIRRSSASLVAAVPYSGDAALPASSPHLVAAQPASPGQTRESIADIPYAPVRSAAVAAGPVAGSSRPPPQKSLLPLAIGGGVVLLVLVAGAVGVGLALREKPQPLVSAPTESASAPMASASSATTTDPPSSGSTAATPTPIANADGTDPHPPTPREGPRPSARTNTDPGKTAPSKSAGPTLSPGGPLTREQRQRLETLQRMCDQGTFTSTECKTKRSAIMRGEP